MIASGGARPEWIFANFPNPTPETQYPLDLPRAALTKLDAEIIYPKS